MKVLKVLLVTVITAVLFTGCVSNPPESINPEDINLIQLQEFEEGMETAVITTTHGTITMVLFEKEAPNTVKHFKKLIKEGFYNNKPIFLQDGIDSFISGSDAENGSTGKVDPEFGEYLKPEVTHDLWHFSGAVSALGKESGFFSKKIKEDSRFFIVGNSKPVSEIAEQMKKFGYPEKIIEEYNKSGGMPQYTGSFTVFGHIVEGMDVVDKLINLEIDEKTGKPTDNSVIQKIELSTYKKA